MAKNSCEVQIICVVPVKDRLDNRVACDGMCQSCDNFIVVPSGDEVPFYF